jgi:hypothetical protein
MKTIQIVRNGEPFLLLSEIKNEAPYSLKFNNSLVNTVSLNLNTLIKTIKKEYFNVLIYLKD